MKKRRKDAGDEQTARNNLNRLFGRLAFEKGNAYGRGDDEEDPIAQLKDDPLVARKRIKSKRTEEDTRPPEAYPGP